MAGNSGRRRFGGLWTEPEGSISSSDDAVDKILKGAKPGDIPVEQPTRFSLVFNLKDGEGFGPYRPAPTLLRADRAIE